MLLGYQASHRAGSAQCSHHLWATCRPGRLGLGSSCAPPIVDRKAMAWEGRQWHVGSDRRWVDLHTDPLGPSVRDWVETHIEALGSVPWAP